MTTSEPDAPAFIERMATYGPCEKCGAARDVRRSVVDGGVLMELFCPRCGDDGG